MRTFFYKKADGSVNHIEAEAMFWNGMACVFVRNGSASAVIALVPGELVWESGAMTEVKAAAEQQEIGVGN